MLIVRNAITRHITHIHRVGTISYATWQRIRQAIEADGVHVVEMV